MRHLIVKRPLTKAVIMIMVLHFDVLISGNAQRYGSCIQTQVTFQIQGTFRRLGSCHFADRPCWPDNTSFAFLWQCPQTHCFVER